MSAIATDFSKLYRDHKKLVLAIILRAGVRGDDAEDLAQDVFVKAFESFGSLSNPERFRSWLGAIAKNFAITALRRSQRRARLGESAMPCDAEGLPAVDERAEGFWQVYESSGPTAADVPELRALAAVAAGQPSGVREAVACRYYVMGMSTTEIAGELGMPVNTVCSHLSRFRRSLRDANPMLDRQA